MKKFKNYQLKCEKAVFGIRDFGSDPDPQIRTCD